MIDLEQIRLAKGLPPLIPCYDWKNNQQKAKKWTKQQVRPDAEIFAWRMQEGADIPSIPTKTEVISYTHQEYEQSLLNPTWTEEETSQLMDLCSEYHLKWPIIHDRLDCDPPKSMEEVKQRYFQVNRMLLVARNQPSAPFTFDAVKEASLRTNLRALMSRSPQVIKEENYLMAEILKFKAEMTDWEHERDYLYKIISHNAEETSGYEARSQKDHRKKGRFAGSGIRRKDKDEEIIKNEVPTTGVHTSSSIIGVHYKPAMQLKINAILEEFGIKNKPKIASVAILETFEQICTAAHQLIDSRKTQDRIQNDLKIANINRKQIDEVGKKKRPASMGGGRDTLFADYLCNSISQDKIWLQITSDHLLRVLRSGQNATMLKMKLSKKDSFPVLTFDITNMSRSQKLVALRHDVPCRVLPKEISAEIKQPKLRIPDMQINLPNLENLRKCIDRLKQINYDLNLRANLAGALELIVDTDGVSVTKFFKGLAPGLKRQSMISEEASNQFVEITVDVREFSKILSCSVLTPLMSCNIFESEALVVKCFVPDHDGVGNIVEFSFHIPLKLK